MATRRSARQQGLAPTAVAEPPPRQQAKPRPPRSPSSEDDDDWQPVPPSMRREDLEQLLAFLAWRVLPLDKQLRKHKRRPLSAWSLFNSAGADCLQPSKLKLLSRKAAGLRGEGWLAGATCSRTLDGRWFLKLRKQPPSPERRDEVVEQFCRGGARQEAQLRALLPKLPRGLTVHLHRLLCYLQNGPPPGGEQPFTTNRGSTLACHCCGSVTCLSQHHLRWGTASQNKVAALKHKQARKDRLLANLRCARRCSTCAQLARPPRCDSHPPLVQGWTPGVRATCASSGLHNTWSTAPANGALVRPTGFVLQWWCLDVAIDQNLSAPTLRVWSVQPVWCQGSCAAWLSSSSCLNSGYYMVYTCALCAPHSTTC